MSSVDNRVVQMRFDNQQFEKGIQSSLKSLDALKKGLNFNASTKGLNELSKAGKSFSLDGIATSVEYISSKFSAMGIIGITALQNIANQAIATGSKMVKALTIEPVMSGFSEYETKVNAIQTILSNTSSKGTTMADVTRVIDELNTYADKTIYNFAEMTRNIGTFTAAGVGLEESAAAIQGIANLAAASGSSSQQASTAMYQLSQALAAGTVKLMDWNSVVNAGMGGQKFQEALKQTAREMKATNKAYTYNVDALIKKNGSFRESLQEGWITADVLNATLQKFTVEGAKEYAQSMVECGKYTQEQADALIAEALAMENAATKVKTFTQLWDTLKESAQSGWSKSWELVVGDFEEAKTSLTEISQIIGDMINASADNRNAVLFESLSSGWKKLVNEGVPDAEFFQDTIVQVASTHDESIAKMVANADSWEESLKNGWLTTDILAESVDEYAKKLNELTEEQREEYGITQEQIDRFNELHLAIQNGEISLEAFAESFTKMSGREKVFESLKETIRFISELIKPVSAAFESIFGIDSAQLTGMIDGLLEFTQSLKVSETTAKNLQRTFEGLFAVFDIGWKVIKAVAGGFKDLITYLAPAGASLLDFTAGIGDYLVGLNESVDATNIFSEAISGVTSLIKKIIDGITSFAKEISSAFSDDGVTGKLEELSPLAERVATRFQPLAALGGAVGKVFEGLGKVLGAVIPLFSSLGSELGNALGNLANWISSSIQNIDFNSVFDALNSGLFAGILASLVKFFNTLNDTVEGGFGKLPLGEKITDILEGVKGALEAWQQSLKADVISKLAKSIAIVAGALTVLSLVDSAKLNMAVGAMAGLFVELVAAMAVIEQIPTLGKISNITKMAPGMIGLATSVLVLSGAVAMLAKCDWEGIVKGLVGVAGCLTALGLFSKFSEVGNMKLGNGLGLMGLAASILILSEAVESFALLNGNQVLQGIASVGLIIATLAAFTKTTSGSKGMISTAVGMTVLSSSMLIFAEAIRQFGGIDPAVLGQGFITMASSMLVMAGAMQLMPNNMLTISAGMLGISAAMVVLAQSMTMMGGMNSNQVNNMITSLAGAMTVLVVSVNLLKTALPGAAAMLVIASAVLVLTPALKGLGEMSLEEIGASLLVLAGAMTVLGVAGYALGPVAPVILTLSAALGVLGAGCLAVGAGVLAFSAGLATLAASGATSAVAITAIVSSLISLIPYLLQQIGQGVVDFATIIGDGAVAIGAALNQVISAIVNTIVESVPVIVGGLMQLCLSILETLAAYAPQIATAGMQLIVGLLLAVASQIPALIDAGIQLMVAFINGMADGLRDHADEVLSAVANLMSSIVEFALTALATMVSGIPGIGGELEAGILQLKAHVRGALAPGDMQATGSEAMAGMASGIRSGAGDVNSAGTETAEQGAAGAGSRTDSYTTAGSNSAASFIQAITDKTGESEAAGTAMAEQGAAGAGSALGSFTDSGSNSAASFIQAITDKTGESEAAGEAIANSGAAGADSNYSGFYSAGANAGAGFVDGIESKLSSAQGAGASIARAAYNAAMAELDEHSPSRVMMEVGAYGTEGFVIGLLSLLSDVEKVGGSIGTTAVESLNAAMTKVADMLSSDLDSAPTIRPVLDTSSIEHGMHTVNGLFNATKTLELSGTRMRTAALATSTNTRYDNAAGGITNPATTVNNNYTQNNYSPKALSSIEIYRQTKNLISVKEGRLVSA